MKFNRQGAEYIGQALSFCRCLVAQASCQLLHMFLAVQAASPWLVVVPWGVRKLLLWITERYGRPPILITENGEGTGSLHGAAPRQQYPGAT